MIWETAKGTEKSAAAAVRYMAVNSYLMFEYTSLFRAAFAVECLLKLHKGFHRRRRDRLSTFRIELGVYQ